MNLVEEVAATKPERLAKVPVDAVKGVDLAFAREILAPGGAYLAKVLQGGTEAGLLTDLKRDFALVRHVKPAASRADSSELYVLATGYRGHFAIEVFNATYRTFDAKVVAKRAYASMEKLFAKK